MQLIPIYSLNSEPFFRRVPEHQLAVALNSEGWQMCPAEPVFEAATQHAPEWVGGEWVVRNKSAEELAVERAAAFPAVSRYQVRQWMIVRRVSLGLAPDPDVVVNGVIDAAVADGVQRVILKDRWRNVIVVPRDHLLVNPVGAAMGLTPAEIDAVWAEIAAL